MRHDEDVRGIQVRPAHPCPVTWDAMSGSKRVRTCATCKSRVYELTGLKRAAAEELLGGATAGLVLREDGTYLERDCPMGLAIAQHSRRWVRRAKLLALSPVLAAVVTVMVGVPLSRVTWSEFLSGIDRSISAASAANFEQREREWVEVGRPLVRFCMLYERSIDLPRCLRRWRCAKTGPSAGPPETIDPLSPEGLRRRAEPVATDMWLPRSPAGMRLALPSCPPSGASGRNFDLKACVAARYGALAQRRAGTAAATESATSSR